MSRVPSPSSVSRAFAVLAVLLAGTGDTFATEAIPPDPLDAEAIPPDPIPDGLESTAPVRDGRRIPIPVRRPAYYPSRVYLEERDPLSPFSPPYRPAAVLPPHCRSRLPPDFALGAPGTIIVAGRELAAETVTAIDPDTCYLGAQLSVGAAGEVQRRWFNPLAIEEYSRAQAIRETR